MNSDQFNDQQNFSSDSNQRTNKQTFSGSNAQRSVKQNLRDLGDKSQGSDMDAFQSQFSNDQQNIRETRNKNTRNTNQDQGNMQSSQKLGDQQYWMAGDDNLDN